MVEGLHVNNKRFIQLKKASCVSPEVLSYRKQGKFINLNKKNKIIK